MHFIGASALSLALGVCIATIVLGILAGRSGVRRYAELARLGVYVQFGLVAIATAALLHSFVNADFAIKYVAGRSDSRMPLHYILSAFYGGQEGSLLLWTFVTAGLGSLAAHVNRDNMPRVMPWYAAVLSATLLGWFCILNFVTPPFETWFIASIPGDGEGLNPLLQTPLMVIHPPCLLSGFASAAVPFSFGIAALAARDTGTSWLKAVRSWTLVCWILLSIGNLLGGMWAYRELGWGGYWAWDAVENAALIPWFIATAFLHSIIIQEQRGMLKRWNVVLVSLLYLLTLVGTWMTRSGFIDSVHTFAESDIGHYFLAFLIFMTSISVCTLILRWKDFGSEREFESPASREAMFLANNWILIGMAAVVLFGTLYPNLAEMVFDLAITFGAPWFERLTIPLGLILLATMALGTILPWRRANLRSFKRHAIPASLATLILAPGIAALWWFTRGHKLGATPSAGGLALSVIAWVLIVLNGAILVQEFAGGIRARRAGTDRGVFSALMLLFRKHRRRYGGFVTHIGVLMIFFAFVGNAFKVEDDITLSVGDSAAIADFTVTFESIETKTESTHVATLAEMTLYRDGERVDSLRPARFDYNNYDRMPPGTAGDPMKVTSEIYIRSTPLEDFYVTMINYSSDRDAAAFKIEVFPFTPWLWMGGFVLILGTIICLWPEEDPVSAEYRRRRMHDLARIGGVVLCLFGLGLVALLPGTAAAQADPFDGMGVQEILAADVPLTSAQSRNAERAFNMVMTTCEGCAGKTLTLASPGCVPANMDKQRIRYFASLGMSTDEILDLFVEERGESAVAIPQKTGLRRVSMILPVVIVILGLFAALFAFRSSLRRTGVEAQPAIAGASSGAADSLAGTVDDELLAELRDEIAMGS